MDIAALSQALDAGVEEGVLPDEGDRQALEIRTARTWLFMLGYLKRNNESGNEDGDFRVGLEAFRSETGIAGTGDGLTGHALSWLKRLVCFDASAAVEGFDIAVDARFAGLPASSPAIARAVTLRLYALDLLDVPPRFSERSDELRARARKGIASFARIYSLLAMGNISPELETETVTALFDTEPLLEKLRSNTGATTVAHPAGSGRRTKEHNREAVKHFVRALARIELWLVGYLSRPRKKMWPRDNANRSLPAAMRAFWRDQPEEARPPKRELEHVDGRFFDRLRDIVADAGESDVIENDRLQTELLSNGELASAVKSETKNLGARLLDGIRRAARFVFGWLRKRLRKLIALARNLASLLVSRTRLVFDSVREIVYALRDSWRFLFADPVPGSDFNHLLIMHDRDFDFVLFRNDRADPREVHAIGRNLGLMARLFAVCWRFVDKLLQAVIALARRSGIGGWFGVLMVLSKGRRWVVAVRETVREILTVREEMKLLSA
ncbi:MAG: hypothetical protein QNJ14_10035 [Woeseiaceae bacterium]|nr:hypothetical protein [Woeseiaceae bacterium]